MVNQLSEISQKRALEKANEFLKVAAKFQLGVLPTEAPHPKTKQLSHWANSDLDQGISVLREIDVEALGVLLREWSSIEQMAESVSQVLSSGGRIFLCGCGATGRLALTLEALWNSKNGSAPQVVSFMAGGDVALVHAIEGFEDYPERGALHLEELGFSKDDLLISCTEGGETPFVIGATLRAAEVSVHRPYFLYCNDNQSLRNHVERSKEVIDDPRIVNIELFTGPMALAGSTRMQASTVLQLAVGICLFWGEWGEPRQRLEEFIRYYGSLDISSLKDFIQRESEIYQRGECLLYKVKKFGITVFTDTTERAPTFSLPSFSHPHTVVERPSLCYVILPESHSAGESWNELLAREPRLLNWEDIDPRLAPSYLQAFDFGIGAEAHRRQSVNSVHRNFLVEPSASGILWQLEDLSMDLSVGSWEDLYQHILLKMLLNIHSTLLMGRLGRYENNLMTWVTPTNGKLVDRACRYVRHLRDQWGLSQWSYEETVQELYKAQEAGVSGESLVLATIGNRRT